MEKYLHKGIWTGVSGWIFAQGDFGVVDSDSTYIHEKDGDKERYICEENGVRFIVEFLKQKNGAVIRTDRCINLTNQSMCLRAFSSRFFMEGNKYEVYTQYSGWQHESSGVWQPLVSGVFGMSDEIRTNQYKG